MVYNAMKLFMEINPQLFDDCSHEYTESQNNAAAREALRERKWAALQEQANKTKKANGVSKAVDAEDEDNQKKLDSLKLDSDRKQGRAVHERTTSVGSSKGQR